MANWKRYISLKSLLFVSNTGALLLTGMAALLGLAALASPALVAVLAMVAAATAAAIAALAATAAAAACIATAYYTMAQNAFRRTGRFARIGVKATAIS